MSRLVAWSRLATALAVSARGGFGRSNDAAPRNPALWPLPQRHAGWHLRHDAKVAEAEARAGQVDLLFVGDSITQNYERAGPPDTLDFRPIWDELFAPRRAMNLGFDGDRTGNVLWRLRHGEVEGLSPKDVVLLLGVNNLNATRMQPLGETSAQTTDGILAVAGELHQRMPAARILVLALLPTNYSAEWTLKTNAINVSVEEQVASLPYARWLDLSSMFMDRARVRHDLYYDPELTPGATALHPSAAAQRRMAEAIARVLDNRDNRDGALC